MRDIDESDCLAKQTSPEEHKLDMVPDEILDRVMGGNMTHEMLKAVVQNLRG